LRFPGVDGEAREYHLNEYVVAIVQQNTGPKTARTQPKPIRCGRTYASIAYGLIWMMGWGTPWVRGTPVAAISNHAISNRRPSTTTLRSSP
jgi:hypothetical protein